MAGCSCTEYTDAEQIGNVVIVRDGPRRKIIPLSNVCSIEEVGPRVRVCVKEE